MQSSGWLKYFLFIAISTPCFSQNLPQISTGGIVNAGSYAQPVSPQSIATVFGTNLASTTASAPSLPTTLAGTTVTVNGIKVPLFYVSPNQINIQVPSSLTYSQSLTALSVVVTTAAGSSAPAQAPFYSTGPGIFSADSTGCGQAAALNSSSFPTTINSPANSASPGDYITLFGTGLGLAYGSEADGTAPNQAENLQLVPGILIDGGLSASPSLDYAGSAPTLVGVDQINFRIPATTRQGCAIPMSAWAQGYASPAFSISIHAGGGQCVDPPAQSYGQVSLVKTVTTGTPNNGATEVLTASFPSGPGLPIPPQPQVSAAGSYMAKAYLTVPVSRGCPVPGYTQLSAGSLQVSSQSGADDRGSDAESGQDRDFPGSRNHHERPGDVDLSLRLCRSQSAIESAGTT